MAAPKFRLDEAEAKNFRDSVTRLLSFTFGDDEGSKNTLSLLLDELVAVDSTFCTFKHEYEGSELLARLTHLVPLYLDRMVAKACHVIFNFCIQKNIELATTDLHAVIQFLTDALQQCPNFVHTEILSALSAVCENNTHRIEKFYEVLVGGRGVLLQLTDDTTHEDEVVVEAVRCLSVFTYMRLSYGERIEVRYLSAIFDTLVHILHRAPHLKMAVPLRNKLLMHCFSGIQNIVMLKRLPNIDLGIVLAAVRAYMFYGLTSQTINIPSQLYPTVGAPYDPLAKNLKPSGDTARKDTNKKTAETVGDSGEPAGNKGRGREGAAAGGDKNKNKKPRRKKGRGRGDEDGGENRREGRDSRDDGARFNASGMTGAYDPAWSSVTPETEAMNWEMTWLKVSSSDSEFSDTEGGKARQQKTESARVRQSAINCFLNIVRVVDKRVMFGYWSSFIPDVGVSTNPPQMQQSLFTTIFKDPSPKCRLAAVASLTNMLESTRPYLAAAEEITTHQPAFTPFSATLGSMIREMHRCLLQALVAENIKAVLTQIIKCLASLVNNVPYHRLNPGLLTRVLKQIRHFFQHKDPNVRTACLTCIGAIVGIKPPLMEVSQLIKPPHPPVGTNRSANPQDSPLFRPEDASYLLYPSFTTPQVTSVTEEGQGDSGNQSHHSPAVTLSGSLGTVPQDDALKSEATGGSYSEDMNMDTRRVNSTQNVQRDQSLNQSAQPNELDSGVYEDKQDTREMMGSGDEPGNREDAGSGRSRTLSAGDVMTPVLGAACGSDTPVYTDQVLQATARETSWVIKMCIKNVTGQTDISSEESSSRLEAFQKYEPLPIRLEALQVISNLIKNYFPVIRQSFRLLENLVQMCLDDSNHIIKLHGTKVLDELTQALQRDVADASLAPNHVIPFQQVLDFWLFLLEGPLPKLLNFNPEITVEGNNLVRSGACECMANIGEEVFAKLPMPRQMQCVTLVLGLAVDDDKLIRASAVRALGIYVMYPSLMDDVAFILDAGKAILNCLSSSSNIVRFKAAWAMANLCDTLVSNKDGGNLEDFVTDFPDSMLLLLVQQAAKSTKDSDKISCNAARAIGKLLKYLPVHCYQQPEMKLAIEAAVKGLVKNMNSGFMKVRWNSCYAASVVFQNPNLPIDQPWVTDILNMLSKVVQSGSNFKVRINAALALSSPPSRSGYGSRETFSNVWTSLVSALETAENINDFAEYKYKDSLTEHLCGAVLRVTSLVELTDLSALSSSVHIKGHSFRTYVERYSRLQLSKKGPSNIPSVEEVKTHLESLEQQATSDDQRRCLQGLLQACVPDTDSADERSPEKSRFQQIYD